MAQSRDAAHDAALVALLRTLTPERLAGVLQAVGAPVPVQEVEKRQDTRRCLVCGHGFTRCRHIDSKAIPSERHEWAPNHSRSVR